MRLIKIFLFLCIFFPDILYGQTTEIQDTISYARNKAYEKNFEEANNLLSIYNSNNNDINGLRLQAQVLYWMKNFSEATIVYEKALSLFPGKAVVKLEYGRMLFELGNYSKARPLLDEFLLTEPAHAEAGILLSYIDLWTGNINAARKRALLLQKTYPDNKESAAILSEIAVYTAPYIDLQPTVFSDDQPLKDFSFAIETGKYFSGLFSPAIKARFDNFKLSDSSSHTLWLQAGNTFSFGSKTSLHFFAGVFQHNNNNEATYKAELSQKISKSFIFELSTEKRPYQYSLASIKNPFLYQLTDVALNFNKADKWLAKAGYQIQYFKDANFIQTIYAWLLAPLISNSSFSLKAGYAFSHANADLNMYQPKSPIPNINNPALLNKEVSGIYDPYFTPNNQIIHAAIASMNISFSKNVSFFSRASIAVSARADNPKFIVVRNNGNQYVLNKTYAATTYNPVEFFNEFRFKCSSRCYLNLNYTYSSLLFYKRNQGSLQFKYLFIHAKNK